VKGKAPLASRSQLPNPPAFTAPAPPQSEELLERANAAVVAEAGPALVAALAGDVLSNGTPQLGQAVALHLLRALLVAEARGAALAAPPGADAWGGDDGGAAGAVAAPGLVAAAAYAQVGGSWGAWRAWPCAATVRTPDTQAPPPLLATARAALRWPLTPMWRARPHVLTTPL
jgi:hypothetical protein